MEEKDEEQMEENIGIRTYGNADHIISSLW